MQRIYLKTLFVVGISAVLGACATTEQRLGVGFNPAAARAQPSFWDSCRCQQAAQPAPFAMQQTVTGSSSQQIFVLGDVLFDFNKASLRPESRDILGQVSARLHEDPHSRALVVGHTDSIGSDGYNVRLSRQRSESVYNALVNSGISPTRVDIEFYGESRPVAENDTDAGRQRNRRVEVMLGRD